MEFLARVDAADAVDGLHSPSIQDILVALPTTEHDGHDDRQGDRWIAPSRFLSHERHLQRSQSLHVSPRTSHAAQRVHQHHYSDGLLDPHHNPWEDLPRQYADERRHQMQAIHWAEETQQQDRHYQYHQPTNQSREVHLKRRRIHRPYDEEIRRKSSPSSLSQSSNSSPHVASPSISEEGHDGISLARAMSASGPQFTVPVRSSLEDLEIRSRSRKQKQKQKQTGQHIKSPTTNASASELEDKPAALPAATDSDSVR